MKLHIVTSHGRRVLKPVQSRNARPIIIRYYHAMTDTWAFKMTHATTIEKAEVAAFKKVQSGEAKLAEIYDETERCVKIVRRFRSVITIAPK